MAGMCVRNCLTVHDGEGQREPRDVIHACVHEFDHLECIRAGSISGLAFMCLLVSIYHVGVSVSGWPHRPYRALFFGVATVEMAAVLVFFGVADVQALMVAVQFLKINQNCLVAIFFYAFAARVLGYQRLLARLVWPTHGIVVFLLAVVAGYTVWSADSYNDTCSSPGWLVLSSVGAVLGVFLLIVAIQLASALDDQRLGKAAAKMKWRLIWLVLAGSLAAMTQCAHDVFLAEQGNCSHAYKNRRAVYLAVLLIARVIDTFIPVLAVSYVVCLPRPTHDPLNSGDGEASHLLSDHDKEASGSA